MRYLKTFKLFEGYSSFVFSGKFPENQEELDKINDIPSVKDISMIFGLPSRFIFGPRKVDIRIRSTRYSFKITKKGKLYYGSYDIGPSTKFSSIIKDWPSLIDYILIYQIARNSGSDTRNLENFVYAANIISEESYLRLKNSGLLEDLVKIAKKYSDPLKIDEILKKSEKRKESYIHGGEVAFQTKAYEKLKDIFNLSHDGNVLKIGSFTPWGLFDEHFKEYIDKITRYDMNLQITEVDKIKTNLALEKFVEKIIKRQIESDIKKLGGEMNREKSGGYKKELYDLVVLPFTKAILDGEINDIMDMKDKFYDTIIDKSTKDPEYGFRVYSIIKKIVPELYDYIKNRAASEGISIETSTDLGDLGF